MQMQTLGAYAQMNHWHRGTHLFAQSQHTQDTTPVDSLLQRRLSASSRVFLLADLTPDVPNYLTSSQFI